ncbi:electron transport oxidoreductase, putative [Talaromyces stipitatus ATCC 10500]|uniref:Electron transport oxidoreductase, putative n=1 Tax=Talaromyces stipitatus (strain ATCC 10500 / CBS 375.48 / QM 6759 / NRRL 1006) TaxID=441959 RepID=B8MKD8_TALSN|nr:electron transport oxidoreductase, putative [Talaromyces stipitatus ATCC 10500]EED15293.1 electron transport oxidoreductase, putative [Talaromyces stipitatus ATCC 10500]
MTERTGGSDVSGTETVAYLSPENERQEGKDASGFELGLWEIDGFKWFSSGTESMMTMLLARTTKGISLFYAPMRRKTMDQFGNTTTQLNCIRIQRLKNKLGTRANTTAELELKGMRAWLIEEEGNGIKQVTQVLSVTRLHIAINCLGNWARGLAASRAYSKSVLAKEHVKYRGIWMLLNFASPFLGASENLPSEKETSKEPFELLPERPEDVLLLLRVLTSPIKGVSARASIHGLLECIEFLGGVGYLENERWISTLRECTVMLLGSAVMDCLNRWIHRILQDTFDALQSVIENLETQWSSLQQTIKESDKVTLMVNANEIMEDLTAIVSGVILVADAARDHDETAIAVARSWMDISFTAKAQRREPGSLEQLKINQEIVFGKI